jgi:hypothetical protein
MISVVFELTLFNNTKLFKVGFNSHNPEYEFWFDWVNLKETKIIWYAE